MKENPHRREEDLYCRQQKSDIGGTGRTCRGKDRAERIAIPERRESLHLRKLVTAGRKERSRHYFQTGKKEQEPVACGLGWKADLTLRKNKTFSTQGVKHRYNPDLRKGQWGRGIAEKVREPTSGGKGAVLWVERPEKRIGGKINQRLQ